MLSGIHGQDGTFLTNLNRIQSRISKENQAITSGLRVSKPSDDASAISSILQYQGQIDHLSQSQSNFALATADASAADGALQSASSILDSISSLASQALTLSANSDTRAILGQQVQALQAQLVSLANTSVQGNYIFGGDSPGVSPYTLDNSSPNGILSNSAASSTRVLTDANGSTRAASLTAGQIFDTRNPANPGSYSSLTDAILTASPALDSTLNPGVAQSFTFNIQGQAAPLAVSVSGVPGGYTSQAGLLAAVQSALNSALAGGSPTLPGGSVTASVDGNNQLQFKSSNLAFTVTDNGADDTAHSSPADIYSTGNPAPDSIFAAVGSLAVALFSNDTTGINSAISALKLAGAHLQTANAFYGNVQNWIESANTSATSQIANLTNSLHLLQDTDLPTAITAMTTDKTAFEAAISAHASLSTKTLFDYLG